MQHYEEKRKGKIRLLSDTIKLGMLDSLKETFKTPEVRGKSEPRARRDPSDLPTGPQPDIRPRVPLERNFTLTNRMAKKIQDKERFEAQQQRLAEEQQARAAAIEKLRIKTEKKEKTIAQNRAEIIKFTSEQAKAAGDKAMETQLKYKSKVKSEQQSLMVQIKEREAEEARKRKEKAELEIKRREKQF